MLLVVLAAVQAVLYTYEDFTAYSIPSASGLNVSAHYICFSGWTLLRYPSSVVIVCNDSLTDALWPVDGGRPTIGIAHPSVAPNYPPPLLDTAGLLLATDWFAFGACADTIVQCNVSIPITNHTYTEDDPNDSNSPGNPQVRDLGFGLAEPPGQTMPPGSDTARRGPGNENHPSTFDEYGSLSDTQDVGYGPTNECPGGIVNYYNVCSNAVFFAMVFPLADFDKAVWARDQLLSFSYAHCNESAIADELAAVVAAAQAERSYVAIDFSSIIDRVDIMASIIASIIFVCGCTVSALAIGIAYALLRKRKAEPDRELMPWKDLAT